VHVGSLVLNWISLLTAGVGALVGAAIASFVWSRRARQTRQDFSFSMRKRAAQAEKLRDQFGELQERLRHHDEQTVELLAARRDLAALRVELEQARATLEDAQRALDASRADAGDADARFASQLESERMDSAERRHHVESELGSARDAMLAMQDDLTSARTNAQRTIERLETDLDATRAMLNQSSDVLRAEREAAAAMRDELRAQIASVDWDRQRAEVELQEVRREWADKLAATQPYIATMREQYLLAAAERDAMVKELTIQRDRTEETARSRSMRSIAPRWSCSIARGVTCRPIRASPTRGRAWTRAEQPCRTICRSRRDATQNRKRESRSNARRIASPPLRPRRPRHLWISSPTTTSRRSSQTRSPKISMRAALRGIERRASRSAP
jgi:hypothetical protein